LDYKDFFRDDSFFVRRLVNGGIEMQISETTEETTVTAEPSQSCLYCRRMDKNSGFLVSYSYCQTNDDCLKDAWNYINRGCESGWTNGKDIPLENCNPK